MASRLAPLTKSEAQAVPPFNPFKLYANTTPLDAAAPSEDGQQDAVVKIVELLGGAMPNEDGQELSAEEVAEVVGRVQDNIAGTDVESDPRRDGDVVAGRQEGAEDGGGGEGAAGGGVGDEGERAGIAQCRAAAAGRRSHGQRPGVVVDPVVGDL